MGSIPLVALAVHAPDALQTAQQATSLRALGQATQQQAAMAPGQLQAQQQGLQAGQQEAQLRGQAIQQGQYAVQDREAGMKAMQEWSGHDINELPDLIQKNGGSLQAVLGAKKSAIEAQQQVMNLNTAQLAQNKTKTDYLLGKLQAATDKSVPDDQLPQSVMGATQQAIKDGYLDPQHAQEVQQLIQQFPDPADLRNHLGIYEKGLMSQSEQFEQETKNRTTAAEEQTAQARVTGAQTSSDRLKAELPGGALQPLDKQEEQDWISKNPTTNGHPSGASDFLAYKATLAPKASKAAQSEGVGGPNDPMVDLVGNRQMDLATALSRMPPSAKETFAAALKDKYPDFNQGEFGVAKKVLEKYTSGNVSDQLLAIGTAREHMKTFGALADALNNNDTQAVNKLGNTLGVQFGSDKVGNAKIAASALSGELGRAFDGAGVVGSERQEWEQKLAPYLSSGQFAGAIKTADALLAGKQHSAEQSFNSGIKAKPNFGGGQSQAGAPAASTPDTTNDPFATFGGKKH